MEQSSYYAVIPAFVRYCKDVPDGAKLLYGEITALCNAQGYCWASNKYFSDLYGKSSDTISRWISQLSQAGFILTLVENQKGNTRKIWLSEAETYRQKSVDPIGKNADTLTAKMPKGYRQKSVDPIGKNAVPIKENNTINITLNNTEEEENAQNALTPPPFAPHGTIEIPETNIPLEAEKKQTDFAGGPGPEFIVTAVVTPQAPYLRIVERVEIQETPGPKSPGEKIREMDDYRIKEAFTMSRKIPAGKFEDYLTAFDAETAATGQKHRDNADLIKHFLNFSGVRWSVEQRTAIQTGQQSAPKPRLEKNPYQRTK